MKSQTFAPLSLRKLRVERQPFSLDFSTAKGNQIIPGGKYAVVFFSGESTICSYYVRLGLELDSVASLSAIAES